MGSMELLVAQSLPKAEDRIQRWREAAVHEAEEQDDTILHLFDSCQSMLQMIIEHSEPSKRPRSRSLANGLERCHGMLTLWADQYGLYDGTLGANLKHAVKIFGAVLESLIPLCKILLRGVEFHVIPHTDDSVLITLHENARRLYTQTKWKLEEENHSSTDSEPTSSGLAVGVVPIPMKTLARKVRIYTECLVDLGSSLSCPALDSLDDDPISPLQLQQHTAEDYHTSRLRDKFSQAEVILLKSLGKTSWNRYQRIQAERELNTQRQLVPIPEDKSQASQSKFRDDSGLGTSIPAGFSSYAATSASLMSSIAGGKRVQIPPLSAEAKTGAPFECNACGKLLRILNERDWRKHLYSDLQPYTCFFADCAFNSISFLNRELWSAHLELEHGFGPDWTSVQCPLCLDKTSCGKRAILAHFAEHMEDIAMIAIPQDVESDVSTDADLGSEQATVVRSVTGTDDSQVSMEEEQRTQSPEQEIDDLEHHDVNSDVLSSTALRNSLPSEQNLLTAANMAIPEFDVERQPIDQLNDLSRVPILAAEDPKPNTDDELASDYTGKALNSTTTEPGPHNMTSRSLRPSTLFEALETGSDSVTLFDHEDRIDNNPHESLTTEKPFNTTVDLITDGTWDTQGNMLHDGYNLLDRMTEQEITSTRTFPDFDAPSSVTSLDPSLVNLSAATGVFSSSVPRTVVCGVAGCVVEFTGKFCTDNMRRHQRWKHEERQAGLLCEAPLCPRIFNRTDARIKHYRKHHPTLAVAALPRRRVAYTHETDLTSAPSPELLQIKRREGLDEANINTSLITKSDLKDMKGMRDR